MDYSELLATLETARRNEITIERLHLLKLVYETFGTDWFSIFQYFEALEYHPDNQYDRGKHNQNMALRSMLRSIVKSGLMDKASNGGVRYRIADRFVKEYTDESC